MIYSSEELSTMAVTNDISDDIFTSLAQHGTAIITSESEFDPERTISSVDFANSGDTSNENCGMCGKGSGKKAARWVKCDKCQNWFHISCAGVNKRQYDVISRDSNVEWTCKKCKIGGAMSNIRVSWGDCNSEEEVNAVVDRIYKEIMTWTKNLMLLPRGKAGKDFIIELTRLINLFVHRTPWQNIAISLVHIFIPLLLQKPALRSKARANSTYLSARLDLWKAGDFNGLIAQSREIQKRAQKAAATRTTNKVKLFSQLMFMGKVSQATRLINNEDSIVGVHQVTPNIIKTLQDKHPKCVPRSGPAQTPAVSVQPVIFEEIDGQSIQDAAKSTFGSGGPTQIDADGWKHILCSKSYGKASDTLAQTIADMAKRLCTEKIPSGSLRELLSCRLMPLDKNPGVRPIGIGEVLRRIIGKAITRLLKPDIVEAAGSLQTCSGVESGIEAAVHAMALKFDDPKTQGIMLVDASNAFNSLHREKALDTVATRCPAFHQYLSNTYQAPTHQFITGSSEGDFIMSEEGCTQGDNCAMAFYSIATSPIIQELHEKCDASQVWYADDSTGGGTLDELRDWWVQLCESGPKYGYHPNPSKTILIVKDPADLSRAQDMFGPLGVIVTGEGQRHLGAVVGTEEFRKSYIKGKVAKWVEDIEQLSDLAVEEPQSAYSAFTKGILHRWTYVMRTVPDIGELFDPLEAVIANQFIPALVGRPVSPLERDILELPVRYGGMGIINPSTTSSREYGCSKEVTKPLTSLISSQSLNSTNLDKSEVMEKKRELKKQKEAFFHQRYDMLYQQACPKLQRHLDQAREKGASTWLTALPLKSLNYVLNKQDFQDSIRLRYGWVIEGTPKICACGTKNSPYHALDCKLGGYVSMRHNSVRDTIAFLLKEAKYRDVNVEPGLAPVNASLYKRSTITQDDARLDVSAVGVYSPFERSFFDIRVTHPNCASNEFKDLKQIYHEHEKAKKDAYEERVLQAEKGTFIPLVFTTSGGMGPMCTMFIKRLVEKLTSDKKERASVVMNHVRTRLRFAILRSTVIAMRGARGKLWSNDTSLYDVSLNIIPHTKSYEMP